MTCKIHYYLNPVNPVLILPFIYINKDFATAFKCFHSGEVPDLYFIMACAMYFLQSVFQVF